MFSQLFFQRIIGLLEFLDLKLRSSQRFSAKPIMDFWRERVNDILDRKKIIVIYRN